MVIGLCDDDGVQLNYIKTLILKWYHKKQVKCDIVSFHSAEELLFEHSNSYPFDLLILDIQMGAMNGMELAKKIRTADKNIRIIFLTGLKDYVFEGYEVGAMRYLLKPIKEEQLYSLLEELNKENNETCKQYFIFNYLGESIKIEQDNIILIEALGHYIKMTTTTGNFDWKYSINQIYKELTSRVFVQVHRSFIINLKYVDRISKSECELSNGMSVPISRNNYKAVNEAFITYHKGERLI